MIQLKECWQHLWGQYHPAIVTLIFISILGVFTTALAQANLTATTTFNAADGVRDYMDIGGTWDGSQDISPGPNNPNPPGTPGGDTFSFDLENDGNAPADDLAVTVELPAGFNYVAGTANVVVSGCADPAPTLAPNQAGTTLTLVTSPGYSLPAGCTLEFSYDLVTDINVVGGTYQVEPSWTYTGDSGSTQQNIVVRPGDFLITKTAITSSAGAGDSVDFEIDIVNSGSGGIFDADIRDSLGDGLGSIVFNPPVTPPGSTPTLGAGEDAGHVFEYIETGQTLTIPVSGTVVGCVNLDNTASIRDRLFSSTGDTLESFDSVIFELENPELDFNPGNFTLDNTTPQLVSIPVNNTGAGPAFNTEINSNLNTIPGLTVTSTSGDWAYDPGTGTFSYTGGSPVGTLDAGVNSTLEFTAQVIGCPPTQTGSTIIWEPAYDNICTAPDYNPPATLQGFTPPLGISSFSVTNIPGISVNKSASAERITAGGSGSYTIAVNGSNVASLEDNVGGPDFTLTDTLPATGLNNIVINTLPAGVSVNVNGSPYTAGDAIPAGATLTVEGENADLGFSLDIDFDVDDNVCAATGEFFDNTANLQHNQCTLNSSSTASFIINDSPGGTTATQELNIVNNANAPFETGLNDTDGIANNEIGEAEAIRFEALYTFSGPGTWAGSVFETRFDATTEEYLDGSLVVNVNGNPVAVPPASITSTTPLRLELDFIAAAIGDTNLDGNVLDILYSVTITDAALGGAPLNASANYLERVDITLNGGPAGCTGARYTQAVQVPLVRANPSIQLSGIPGILDVCQEIPVTATITPPQPTGAAPPSGTRADNFFVDIDLANYEFIGDPTTDVTIGGHLSGDAGLTTSAGGSGLIIDATDNFSYENGDGNSTATFNVRYVPNAGGFPNTLTGTLEYDDWQTQSVLSGTREFSSSASAGAFIVREGNLDITVSPQIIPIVSRNVTWNVTVTNVGTGTAYGVVMRDLIPDGLTVDPATSSPPPDRTTITLPDPEPREPEWDIAPIPPGQSVTITVGAFVNETNCDLNVPPHDIIADWGCGGITNQTLTTVGPRFDQPAADLEIIHDTTETQCTLCGEGTIVLEVRNTGGTNLYDVIVSEDLGGSGLTYILGTTEISVEGAPYVAAGDPTVTGGGNILTWTDAEIAELAELDTILGSTADAIPQEIFIRFDVRSPGETLNRAATFEATADYEIACGLPGSEVSPGVPLTDVLDQPDIVVRKTGRNVTAGQVGFTEDVFAGAGDTVVWEIEIENRGNVDAEDFFLRDFLSGTSNFDITDVDDDPAFGSPLTPDVTATAGRDQTYFLPDVPANSTVTYFVRGTVNAVCNTTTNTAEVEWGCDGEGARGGLSDPTDNNDTGRLITEPSFVNGGNVSITQTLVSPSGGPIDTNGIVTIVVENNGGTAQNLDLTNTLPTGYVYDSTFTPTITSSGTYTGQIDQVTVNAATPTEPVFDLTSSTAVNSLLRFDETATLTFRIVQNANFDTTQDPTVREETDPSGNNLDPAAIVDSTNQVRLDFTNTCGDAGNFTADVAVTPATPDLDVDIDGNLTRILSGVGDTETFTIRVNNRGDGEARNGTLNLTFGDGWQDITVGDLTTAGCVSATVTPGASAGDPTTATCELPDLGGTSNTTFPLTLTVANTDHPLTFSAQVEGDIEQDDGTDTTNNYSLDIIVTSVVGFDLSKTLQSCTEVDSTNPTVFVGEDCIYRISASWFGGGGQTFSNIQVTDVLPAGLGYIAHTVDPNGTNTTAVDTETIPAVGTDDTTLVWNLTDFDTSATPLQTFEVDVITRVLNDALNSDGAPVDNDSDLTNVTNGSFTFDGNTFDDTTDGFPVIDDRRETVTVSTPDLTLTKQVRNVTNGGTFGDDSDGDSVGDDNAAGEAGDVFEYRIVISNAAGRAPAYDLELVDTLPPNTKLAIQAFVSDGIDNDGEGGSDEAAEGNVAGQIITFNNTTTASALFDELPAGSTITLLYRVTAQIGVNPSEVLTNDADLTYDTLPGDSGSQTAGQEGTSGTATGAREYTLTDTADIVVDVITTEAKEIIGQEINIDGFDFSANAIDGSTVPNANVVIGEQIQYRLTVQVPFSTINNFRITDQLPAGMSLVSFDGFSDPSGVCDNNPPITTPAVPTSTTGGVNILWEFGDCRVDPGDSNVLTVTYTAQVLNVATNVEAANLTNNAGYASDSDTNTFDPITVVVREPDLEITKTLSPNNNVDAGDTVTVTLEVANTGNAPAYNVVVTDLLNDNQVDDPGDGNVDVSDATIFDCTLGATDTTAVNPGIFTFDNGDGDGDSTDETNDCLVRYEGFDLAAGVTATFTFEVTISGEIILNGDGSAGIRDYDNTANVTATSLPTGALGDGDDDFERDGSNGQSDDTFDDAFNATSTDTLVSTRVPNPGKIFIDSTDAFTELNPNNGDVTIGEVITVELTFTIPEGTLNDVRLEDRIRLRDGGSNFGPADVTFLAAELQRSSNTLNSSNDPGSINGVIGTFVDVSGDIVENNGGGGANQFRRLRLNLGTVVNSDTNNGVAEIYTLRLTYRFDNNVEHQAERDLRNQPRFESRDADGNFRGRTGPSRDLDILEPDLSVDKAVRNVTRGDPGDFSTITAPAIGEVLEYRVVITNNNTDASVAYDIGIIDTLPEGLAYVDGSTVTVDGNPNNGTTFPAVVFGNPSATGNGSAGSAQVLTWGRERIPSQKIDLAPGAELSLTYQVVVLANADLSNPIENLVTVDYTSLDGTDDGLPGFDERTGDDGASDPPDPVNPLNNYETSASASTAIENSIIGLSKRLTTLGNNLDGTYDAGFSFTVTNLGNTDLDNVQVIDDLTATFPAPATIINVGPVNVSGDLTAANANFDGDGDTDLLSGTESLAPTESATISFLVTFNPNQSAASYTNTATVISDDPDGDPVTDISQNGDDDDPDGDGDPTNNSDPTPLALSEAPAIGLAKVLNGIIDNGNGTFTLSLTFRVANVGDVDLNNVQVIDDLTATFPTPATYTVVTVTSPALTDGGNPGLTANPAFDGDATQTLLDGIDSLAVGDESTIGLVILLTPNQGSANYDNSATASGESGTGTVVEDVSQDGTDIDPDGDGDPGNNGDPTPIVVARTPIVGIAKRVLTIIPDTPAAGTYRVTYEIKVENLGNVPLVDVNVQDDLAATFATLGGSFSNVSASVSSGTLTINSGYDGVTDILLTDPPNSTLGVGAESLIELVVDVTPLVSDFNALGAAGPYDNQASVTATNPSRDVTTTDLSDDGQNTDFDADNNPNEPGENDPTPLTLTRIGTSEMDLQKYQLPPCDDTNSDNDPDCADTPGFSNGGDSTQLTYDIEPGQYVVYTIEGRVQTDFVQNVVITDEVPEGLVFVNSPTYNTTADAALGRSDLQCSTDGIT
ncbi:MAG: isopeptide-forming domain-containing fimbrial protein, partial [Deinococcota bacterium]